MLRVKEIVEEMNVKKSNTSSSYFTLRCFHPVLCKSDFFFVILHIVEIATLLTENVIFSPALGSI